MTNRPVDNQQEPAPSPLRAAFMALSQDRGVYQGKLRNVLGSELPRLWHIEPDDDEHTVRIKAIWQLERLIDTLSTEDIKIMARLRFNLLDESNFPALTVSRRVQRYQDEHRGPSASTVDRRMGDTIIPSFEARLRNGPMPPVPAAVLAATEASAAGSLTAAPAHQVATRNRARTWAAAGAAVLFLVLGGVGGWLLHSASGNAPSGAVGGGTTQPLPTGGPIGTGAYPETAGSAGAATYRDPHTVSGSGLRLKPYQQVTVTCKVYAPVMASLGPGWWYRIQTAPWNGQFSAPANSFLNGDPIGVDVHHVDSKVPTCP